MDTLKIVVFIFVFLSSCLINISPVYFDIPYIEFEITGNEQGTNSHLKAYLQNYETEVSISVVPESELYPLDGFAFVPPTAKFVKAKKKRLRLVIDTHMIKPGTVDKVTHLLLKKRNTIKDVMPVTGRADICVLLQGSLDYMNTTVIEFKKIKDIVSTETLVEVEVDLGW